MNPYKCIIIILSGFDCRFRGAFCIRFSCLKAKAKLLNQIGKHEVDHFCGSVIISARKEVHIKGRLDLSTQ